MAKGLSKKMMMGLLVAIALSGSCKLYNLERQLAPTDADFLSKVRYLITRDERKAFLELPDSEKPKFIEDFWERRNPVPGAAENVLKTEYFNRIERANKLFVGEGTPGWLTDRGRIFIIYGPPTDRMTQPMAQDAYTRCGEVWSYGNYPVVFSDPTCTGNYRLATFDLAPLRDLNINTPGALNVRQSGALKAFGEEKRLFDFNASLKIVSEDAQKIEAKIVLDVPFGRIWFKSDGKKMTTTLDLGLELMNAKNEIVWQKKATHDLALDEGDLAAKGGEKFVINIPLSIKDDKIIEQLGQGKRFVAIILTNRTGSESMKKVLEFK